MLSQAGPLTTVTSETLLLGLRDPEDREAWQRFVSRYRSVLVSYARRRGLSDNDAQDAAQESLLRFSSSYLRGQYDPMRGRLRTWLLTITRNCVTDALRARRDRHIQLCGSSDEVNPIASLADHDPQHAIWEEEWRRAVLRACLDEAHRFFDSATIEAFTMSTIDDMGVEEVASKLSITRNSVYLARHRVLKKIRELLPAMESIW